MSLNEARPVDGLVDDGGDTVVRLAGGECMSHLVLGLRLR